ncbi:hypothetical protein ccbrp13_39910 [Ktedonobacteria bacterium brp13]|nr:hypothetical protein ccbrp13_39910 [Ktedonobacteria bacterium brp13]
MTDHHEEFVAGKIEEQLDILFQADDAVASPFPQPGQRLIQDLHTLSTYTLDKQADQASLARVQQRLQQHSDRITTKRLNDGNTPTMSTIHTTTIIEDDQQRNNAMRKLFAQRSKKPWLEALVAILALGLCISLLMAFLNIYPFNNISHPNITPTATPTYNNLQKQVTPGVTPAAGTATPTAEPLPVVQTSCPASGTVRPAVMTPMATTSHQGILYTSNFPANPSSSPTQIKRYDVTTGTTTALFTTSTTGSTSSIGPVLVSANGQWITFLTLQNGIRMFHLMRADGQALQTVYCTSDRFANLISWSPNQHYLILSDSQSYNGPVYLTLLDLTTGSMREILEASVDVYSLQVVNWVGNTGIYVNSQLKGEAINCNTYNRLSFLSDITKDISQQANNLQNIPLGADANVGTQSNTNMQCQNFSMSPDSSQLLLDKFIAVDPRGKQPPVLPSGPSTLSLRPIQGGNEQIINDAPTHNIDRAGFITNSRLWFIIANPATNNSKNGLWVMNTDSTGLTCLISEQATNDIYYGDMSFTQDAQNIAIHTYTDNNSSLVFGSLNGGSLTTFATGDSKEAFDLIGWVQF